MKYDFGGADSRNSVGELWDAYFVHESMNMARVRQDRKYQWCQAPGLRRVRRSPSESSRINGKSPAEEHLHLKSILILEIQWSSRSLIGSLIGLHHDSGRSNGVCVLQISVLNISSSWGSVPSYPYRKTHKVRPLQCRRRVAFPPQSCPLHPNTR